MSEKYRPLMNKALAVLRDGFSELGIEPDDLTITVAVSNIEGYEQALLACQGDSDQDLVMHQLGSLAALTKSAGGSMTVADATGNPESGRALAEQLGSLLLSTEDESEKPDDEGFKDFLGK